MDKFDAVLKEYIKKFWNTESYQVLHSWYVVCDNKDEYARKVVYVEDRIRFFTVWIFADGSSPSVNEEAGNGKLIKIVIE